MVHIPEIGIVAILQGIWMLVEFKLGPKEVAELHH